MIVSGMRRVQRTQMKSTRYIRSNIEDITTERHKNSRYVQRKDSAFSTPFCTFSSGTRYSFISAGKTVKGEHVSATIAIATVVHTRF
jgi:hypothetical protein